MSKLRVGDVVVCHKQKTTGDTDFLYGQIGLIVKPKNRFLCVRTADNDFDDWVGEYSVDTTQLTKIGVL